MNLKLKNRLVLLFVTVAASLYGQNSVTIPAVPSPAKKVAKADTLHGDIRIDNYFWLRDKNNPEVIEYLKAEDSYAEALMAPAKSLQEKIYNEMVARIKETDLDVPYRDGNYFYYTRTEKGKQYAIYCRKKESLDAPEEIILDQNEMAKAYKYFRLGALSVSPDGAMLAFSFDSTGYEAFKLVVKDLRTGEFLKDYVDDVVSVVWAMDNKTIFYTTRDHARRPYRLWRHSLATDQQQDKLIYEEKDELFRVFASRSKSKQYVFLYSSSSTSDEVRYVSAAKPMEEFKTILPREKDHEYSVDHHGDQFYIVTNKHATTFRLVKAPTSNPSEKNWQNVLPHRPGITLEGIEVFADYLIAFEREKGLQKMRVMDLKKNAHHYIEFPEPVYSAFNNVNRVWDTQVFRFSYQSLITPNSIYDYTMDMRERALLKQTEVLGGYDPAQYQSERIYARAADGVEIPISLVYKKGMSVRSVRTPTETPSQRDLRSEKRDGTSPLHLYGYGSYGASSQPTFSSSRLSLLDRGITYAIAHIRGGGDVGREWYDDGKLLKKMNTFTDFIACAEHLIKEKYTASNRLTIEGGSAGGLLVGAVTNMRPDLFKAVVAQVPFVDVLNTMLDASLPLTVGEYLEWGNPNERESYFYMKSYCPYTNVKAQAYPTILVKVGLNDPRVSYWEGTKWVARLRELKTDKNNLMLKVNFGTGHGGASGRYDRLREIAFDYSFILSQHNIAQ